MTSKVAPSFEIVGGPPISLVCIFCVAVSVVLVLLSPYS